LIQIILNKIGYFNWFHFCWRIRLILFMIWFWKFKLLFWNRFIILKIILLIFIQYWQDMIKLFKILFSLITIDYSQFMLKMFVMKVSKFPTVILKFSKKLLINIVIFIKILIFQQFYKQVKQKLSFQFLLPHINHHPFEIKIASSMWKINKAKNT